MASRVSGMKRALKPSNPKLGAAVIPARKAALVELRRTAAQVNR